MDADVAPSPGCWAELAGGGGGAAAAATTTTTAAATAGGAAASALPPTSTSSSSATLASLLTALDDAACCAICREFLDAPMVLECGHACEFVFCALAEGSGESKGRKTKTEREGDGTLGGAFNHSGPKKKKSLTHFFSFINIKKKRSTVCSACIRSNLEFQAREGTRKAAAATTGEASGGCCCPACREPADARALRRAPLALAGQGAA